MAKNCSLLKFCFIMYILSIWYNTFVTTSDELENMDFEQSDNESALTPLQIELLQKWHINVNIKKLNNITNQYIDGPKKMTTNLLRMILGKQLLHNMSVRKIANSGLKYNPIPENVKNFVLEYVNSNTESGIDNSTFCKTVMGLCNYERSRNRDQLFMNGDKVTLTPLQNQLLQKWSINANDEILMNITRKYNDRPNIMIIELLKMILGHNFLKHMAYKNLTISYIKNEIIPKNVPAFILEYVNLHTKSNIDLINLWTVIRKNINHLRHKLKSTPLMKDELLSFSQDVLPEFSTDVLPEFSTGVKITLTPLQSKLLQKWTINANDEILMNITRKYNNRPKIMITKLLKMILGHNILKNMAYKNLTLPYIKKNIIPENVQYFILEYVNLHTKSNIDVKDFWTLISKNIRNLKQRLKSTPLIKDELPSSSQDVLPDFSKGDEVTLTPLQNQLLQKWSINANHEILMNITRKYNNRPKIMIMELLEMILGHNFLQNMVYKNLTLPYIKNYIIPKNVQYFILEYVNLHTKSNIDLKNFWTVMSKNIRNLRQRLKRTQLIKDELPSSSQDVLPDFSIDELGLYGIEFEDADLDMSKFVEPVDFL